ncbi:hypothetical protein T11_1567 [Trichinella zimbabwensis]|uniref:Uncharacterized protein n=1 Tax=Trichinella zimbabwensis TaxID=268475 RepID=A0A0V1GW65_9BILA|nr:hypothetical protein T11_1567 [Trichinella zimbabwensis]
MVPSLHLHPTRPPVAETSRLNSQSVQFTKAGDKGREDSK